LIGAWIGVEHGVGEGLGHRDPNCVEDVGLAPRTLAYWATAERAAATDSGTAGHARFSGS
jgi:hypothetical protein